MVATEGVDADTSANQTSNLAIEEQADGRVLPLAIVDIAGDDQKGDAASDGLIDQRDESIATGSSQACG